MGARAAGDDEAFPADVTDSLPSRKGPLRVCRGLCQLTQGRWPARTVRGARGHSAFQLGGCHPRILMRNLEIVSAVVAVRHAQSADIAANRRRNRIEIVLGRLTGWRRVATDTTGAPRQSSPRSPRYNRHVLALTIDESGA
ncbi:hypothetical protein SAMN05421763_103657 [[Luteovulum] sphaeroides subsp. megalophilum]|nr:hypothetical protein SAMN05421763_103657 [[Luteovulum] sphaeroides subsp. megalophilum]